MPETREGVSCVFSAVAANCSWNQYLLFHCQEFCLIATERTLWPEYLCTLPLIPVYMLKPKPQCEGSKG